MKNISIIFLLVVLGTCCSPKKSPIEYGLEKCHYCKMTIVDQRFGCELVTSKGRVYKFDATECMVHYMDAENHETGEISLLLTNTWDSPGELIHVADCYFLQSENMPSPMGEFINPFSEKTSALEYQESRSGRIYQWDDLKDKLESKIGSR